MTRTHTDTKEELGTRVEAEAIELTDDGVFPNNGRLPLLLYRKSLPPAARGPDGSPGAVCRPWLGPQLG